MPAAIPLAAAAIGVGASAAAGAAGVGKNSYRATSFGAQKEYDPNRFEYGGVPGGANMAAERYMNQAQAAQGRQGAQANYGQANAAWDMGVGARQQQVNMAQLMANRASGAVPSLAQMQADRQIQQGLAAQASMQASARGPAGLALAQQNAANNVANMQGAISNQAQINAANERMQAEQAAFGAYAGMRQGDLGMQQAAAQQAQYNAGLQQQQHGLNDQMTLGMTQAEQNVRNMQLNAGMNQQGMLSGSHNAAQGINSGINQANAGREMQFFQAGLGAVQGAAGMAGGGGGGGTPPLQGSRAEGGPVAAGGAYLVGERGPEIIVPQQHGLVIPNEALPPPPTWRDSQLSRGLANVRDQGPASLPLTELPGIELHQGVGEGGKGFYQLSPQAVAARESSEGGASLSGDTKSQLARLTGRQVRPDDHKRVEGGIEDGVEGGKIGGRAATEEEKKAWYAMREQQAMASRPAPAPARRPLTPAELMLMADALDRKMKSDHAARMAAGPAISAREDGGPVVPGRPYVVGERGPEVVATVKPPTWQPTDPLAGLAPPPKPQAKPQPRKLTPEEEAEDARIMAEFNQGGGEVMKFGKLSDEEKRQAEEERRRGDEIHQKEQIIEQAKRSFGRLDDRDMDLSDPVNTDVENFGRGLAAGVTPQERADRDARFRAWFADKQKTADRVARFFVPQAVQDYLRKQPGPGNQPVYVDGTPRYPGLAAPQAAPRQPVGFVRGGQ